MATQSIFVSYRHGDSNGAARLAQKLEQEFGAEHVFFDIDGIPPGVDFYEYLRPKLEQSRVLLAVIGPAWVRDTPRLHQPGDYVSMEIEAALGRKDVPVIPILIDGASLPDGQELPENLRPLTQRNAVVVAHASYAAIVDHQLIPELRKLIGHRSRNRRRWSLVAAALASAIVVTALFPWSILSRDRPLSEERENALKAGDSFAECGGCPRMVAIPAGTFEMGAVEAELRWRVFADEVPRHTVKVRRYALGQTPVTFDQWQVCADNGYCTSNPKPTDDGRGRGNRPVVNVSHKDALAFVTWMNSLVDGSPYRLPSEAEWEYAARAGAQTIYAWGDEPNREAGNVGNSGLHAGYNGKDEWTKSSPVANFPPNAFGLHDMVGNVWEWVQDCYHPNYEGAPTDGSAWETGACGARMARGGNWNSEIHVARPAARFWRPADSRNEEHGFRIARHLSTP